MIKITIEGAEVRAALTSSWESGGCVFQMTWNAGTDWAAQLLAWSLNQSLRRHVQAIREKAYCEGWRDAKSKLKKQTTFSDTW